MNMKTYEILLNTKNTDDVINDRITAIIVAITGMPLEDFGLSIDERDTIMLFDATEEQSKAVAYCLDRLFTTCYVGMREVE